MRKLIVVASMLALLVAPAGAVAKPNKTDVKNASQACKAERAADSDAFKAKYGNNKNGKNAFGKCVSQTAKAKAKADEDEGTDEDEDTDES